MPRKQRIEYPGAIYHVLSRGNYRKELFLHHKTGEAFESCLFEAVDRCGWKFSANDRKGADWKAKIARDLRANTTAGNIWIARRLNMGHPSRITNLIRNVS